MRPTDLAHEHGLSAQAVRNYESAGFLPEAQRTSSGYRVYTETHAAALRAYLSLVTAYGYATSGRIMTALNAGHIDRALEAVDHGHALLLRDRSTLNTVKAALSHLGTGPEPTPDQHAAIVPFSIGELSRRLELNPATLRNWERAGILTPQRDPATGHRCYRAHDIRDAELAHLLRRGGHPLDEIATITREVRTVGGTSALNDSLEAWQRKLTARGLAMVAAAAHLDVYISLIRTDPATLNAFDGG